MEFVEKKYPVYIGIISASALINLCCLSHRLSLTLLRNHVLYLYQYIEYIFIKIHQITLIFSRYFFKFLLTYSILKKKNIFETLIYGHVNPYDNSEKFRSILSGIDHQCVNTLDLVYIIKQLKIKRI